jgi:hypothetical protein
MTGPDRSSLEAAFEASFNQAMRDAEDRSLTLPPDTPRPRNPFLHPLDNEEGDSPDHTAP